MTSPSLVDSLRLPFRSRALNHDEILAQARAWADAFPAFVKVSALATSTEGRDVVLLTIGPDPDRTRPSVWVDGNMHANELAGSSVALGIAEDFIRLHVEGVLPDGIAPHLADVLRDVRVFVAPRLSPDGAETVLLSARYVRSNPRDRRTSRLAPRWVTGDVDGDGQALSMRLVDRAGDYVASGPDGRVMRARELDDPGPFYRVLPEGHIEGYDGKTIPDPYFLSDNEVDLNRNFPFDWRAEPEQVGAGGFATSEPETRGVVAFATQHPEIFAWLNLHCFGGVVIRPSGHKPDNKMPPDELALFRQLEAWSEADTGYPTVSGFEEFTYEPEKPIRGDIVSWAFEQRGAFAWTVELWDLFKVLGIPRPKRFVELYEKWRTEDLERFVAWDAEHNQGRVFRGWAPFQHPQLGALEVGGIDPRIGIWNPPPEELDKVCRGQSRVFMKVAAMAPRLVVEVTKSAERHGDLSIIDVMVENQGYLPTYVLPSAKERPWNEPVWVEVVAVDGVTLKTKPRVPIGHLEGWGRGRMNPGQSLFMPQSRGSAERGHASFTVASNGSFSLRVGSARVGFQTVVVTVGAS